MRGRKPKPTMLHALHGRPSKTAKDERANEPQPVTGTLYDAPEWMNAAQKIGWAYAIEHAPPGLLAHIDRGVLAVWIIAEDLHRRAAVAQNNAATLLVKAPITGTPLQSPYLAIINRQGLIMIKAAGELGFSPVSRPRIGAGIAPSAPMPGRTAQNGVPKGRALDLEAFLDSHPDNQTVN